MAEPSKAAFLAETQMENVFYFIIIILMFVYLFFYYVSHSTILH